MAKTELLKPYLERIEALGDQLWYFLFVSEELNQNLERYSSKAKEHYTVDLFATNPFSQRIYIKANKLIDHQNQNKKFTFGSYFSTSYEIVSNYLKDSFANLKSFNTLPNYNWVNQEPPEQNFRALLSNNFIPLPDPFIFNTFTYLRLRRNHFTHLINTANARLIGFCGANGANLNTHWVNSGTINNIDFSSAVNVNDYSQEITIDLMKALRITLIEFDSYLASILNLDAVINSLVQRKFGSENITMNSIIAQKRSSQIIFIARTELGLVITEAQCNPYVRSIGVK